LSLAPFSLSFSSRQKPQLAKSCQACEGRHNLSQQREGRHKLSHKREPPKGCDVAVEECRLHTLQTRSGAVNRCAPFIEFVAMNATEWIHLFQSFGAQTHGNMTPAAKAAGWCCVGPHGPCHNVSREQTLWVSDRSTTAKSFPNHQKGP
jgi:hypothetical protein